jgi:SAM-dependent methyltransferase
MEPAVLAWRQQNVTVARRDPVPDRLAYLRGLAVGKRVLDVGVVDHSLESGREWLHGALCEVASYCLGVDIIAADVERLQARGFNVLRMDITTGELPDDTFDLVVAGEVVEHLGSPGGLFEAASKVLAPDGRLVLTTPNPYALWRVYQHLRGRVHENVDHVTLFSPWSIGELAERAGLELESFRGVRSNMQGAKARTAQFLVGRRLLPFVSESACESIIYEFTRAKSD